ncbi:MAG TPA: hypothetical protein VHF02_08340 [Luteimonas sp.]|nr:hypothetical protein [Luteimonas sp.]
MAHHDRAVLAVVGVVDAVPLLLQPLAMKPVVWIIFDQQNTHYGLAAKRAKEKPRRLFAGGAMMDWHRDAMRSPPMARPADAAAGMIVSRATAMVPSVVPNCGLGDVLDITVDGADDLRRRGRWWRQRRQGGQGRQGERGSSRQGQAETEQVEANFHRKLLQ